MAPEEKPAIHNGETADIGTVLELWRVAESLPTATDTEPALESLLDRDSGALLLASSGNEIVGSLIAAWDGWRGSFYRLAVHPGRRRQGIAVSLIRAGEERLQALGATRLSAIVASDEAAAQSLWAAAGYERQPDRSRFVRNLSAGSEATQP